MGVYGVISLIRREAVDLRALSFESASCCRAISILDMHILFDGGMHSKSDVLVEALLDVSPS